MENSGKKIAKNTLLLYFRMLFLMAVSLYTSRVVLNALGINDFGIYNVVGGIVSMFSVLSGSLSAAISRFITYELGKGNVENLKKVFSSAVTTQLCLGLILLLLAETIGVWFLNTKMNIPSERMLAANWVLQFSFVTFLINLISVPYNAAIIAHERMAAFAYISIIEVLGKLLIAYLIVISNFDKLISYAVLMCLVAIIVRLVYGYYCRKKFEECTCHFVFDRVLLKQMFGFAGWNFIGSSAVIFRDQGVNVVLNIFCGPVVNAARGISFQINGAVLGFVSNFMTALNPQIIKSYASDNRKWMETLIYQGARFSFYMLLLLSIPILLETEAILVFWLKTVPAHTVSFVRLVLILALSEVISGPLVTALLATGNIKKYQLFVGGLNFLNFPISYALLRWGGFGNFPEVVFLIAILISQGCLFGRLLLLSENLGMSIRLFFKKVYFNVICVSLLSIPVPILFFHFCTVPSLRICLVVIFSLINTALAIIYIGCTLNERVLVLGKIKTLLKLK